MKKFDSNNGLAFKGFFSDLAGRFTEHIDRSIPEYALNREVTVNALAHSLTAGQRVLDIGASEGKFGEALKSLCDARVTIVNIDPNPDMKRAHNELFPGSSNEYLTRAWCQGFVDNGLTISAYHPYHEYDIVHCSMVRQFVTPDAVPWYKAAYKALRPNGMFILNTKLGPDPDDDVQWRVREEQKNLIKREYFSEQEISDKQTQVLEGMHANLLSYDEEVDSLLEAGFKYVSPYWHSYNFAGFLASDDILRIRLFRDTYAQVKAQAIAQRKD